MCCCISLCRLKLGSLAQKNRSDNISCSWFQRKTCEIVPFVTQCICSLTGYVWIWMWVTVPGIGHFFCLILLLFLCSTFIYFFIVWDLNSHFDFVIFVRVISNDTVESLSVLLSMCYSSCSLPHLSLFCKISFVSLSW